MSLQELQRVNIFFWRGPGLGTESRLCQCESSSCWWRPSHPVLSDTPPSSLSQNFVSGQPCHQTSAWTLLTQPAVAEIGCRPSTQEPQRSTGIGCYAVIYSIQSMGQRQQHFSVDLRPRSSIIHSSESLFLDRNSRTSAVLWADRLSRMM